MSDLTKEERAKFREHWERSHKMTCSNPDDPTRRTQYSDALRVLDALDAAERDLAYQKEISDQYESELKVEELHAEGKTCEVCTHMEFEQIEALNIRLLDDVEKVEAERDRLRKSLEDLAEPGVMPDGEPLPEWVHMDELRRLLGGDS